jgi:hypothetical protein
MSVMVITTTAHTHMSETAEVKPKAPEIQVVEIKISDRGITHEIHEKRRRGKDEIQPICLPVLQTDKLDDLLAYARLVGVTNFVATVNRDILRPAAYEASEVGFSETGFNQVKYLEDFKSYFDPRAQKSRGPKKADIIAAQAKLAEELTELVVKMQAGQFGEPEKNRFMVIKVEMAKLGELKAKKERRGKAPVTAAK